MREPAIETETADIGRRFLKKQFSNFFKSAAQKEKMEARAEKVAGAKATRAYPLA